MRKKFLHAFKILKDKKISKGKNKNMKLKKSKMINKWKK